MSRPRTSPALHMSVYLQAVVDHGFNSFEYLVAQGFHPKVIVAKAEKAADKGYTDYGTWAGTAWIEDKGRIFLGVEPTAPRRPARRPEVQEVRYITHEEVADFRRRLAPPRAPQAPAVDPSRVTLSAAARNTLAALAASHQYGLLL